MENLDKRTIASRENGKLGGPKTTEGAQRSAANAYKHGLYARKAPVLTTEDRRLYDALAQQLITHHQPKGPQELDLLDQLTDVIWRYHRYESCQEWFLEGMMAKQAPRLAIDEPDISKDARHAVGLHGCLTRTNTPFRELSRLLDRLQRAQHRLLSTLKDLQGPRFNTGLEEPAETPEKHGNEPRTAPESTTPPSAETAWTPLASPEMFPDPVPGAESEAEEAPPLYRVA